MLTFYGLAKYQENVVSRRNKPVVYLLSISLSVYHLPNLFTFHFLIPSLASISSSSIALMDTQSAKDFG